MIERAHDLRTYQHFLFTSGMMHQKFWISFRCVLCAVLFTLLLLSTSALGEQAPLVSALLSAPYEVRLADGSQADTNVVRLEKTVEGDHLQWTLRNTGPQPVAVRDVTLYDWLHGLPGDSAFYGESYTMLSQTGGTLTDMVDIGQFTDRKHYRFAEPPGFRTVYGMMTVTPPDSKSLVIGFSSCHRFVGRFHVNASRLQVVVHTEDKTLQPGESWQLEELLIAEGDRNQLLAKLADRLTHHHPRQNFNKLPTGWCSWYCFGPRVTAKNVTDNLKVIRERLPQMQFVQIDDGYQPWMGDWLETGKAFGGGVQNVLKQIREAGFEPAIWVAPFVASPESTLFRDHPEWFIQDEQGNPLPSNKFTFGGWRLGPWYMLDGTHPGAQEFLEHVFRTMREEWGCTYFKLDANVWGAMPFGKHHDPKATSVEAYRQGMAAVRRGAGDAFLLGCNHPIWPSIGEVHGSRASRDIVRKWKTFTGLARENLMRNWQNNRLWWNDPDCLVLSGEPPANEESFHIVATFASGGMLLSGDDLTQATDRDIQVLQQCIDNPGQAAEFETSALKIGWLPGSGEQRIALLNWEDQPEERVVRLKQPSQVIDYFSGDDLGTHHEALSLRLPPRSGRLLRAIPTGGVDSP